MNKRILFVSHRKAQCGVFEFGKSITDVLRNSKVYEFIRVECSSLGELHHEIETNAPDAIIYNYYESVLPWVVTRVAPRVYRNNIALIRLPQIGIIHEITQQVADTAVNYRTKFLFAGISNFSSSLFDFYIAPDPTLLLYNPIVYKTGRLIPSYQNSFPLPQKLTVGSFGFGTPKKGFEKIVQLVQQEFDEAVIRFNIPSADFGNDRDGAKARAIAEKCKALITKPGIQLKVTHDFHDSKAMLDFLAQNTVNMFLYEHNERSGKGLSSAVDNAMAVQRPVAVSDAVMFRHIFDTDPSICIARENLRSIIRNGFAPLQKHYDEWNATNVLWDYERIVTSVFAKLHRVSVDKTGVVKKLRSSYRKIFSIPDNSFTWLRNSEKATEDDLRADRSLEYQPVSLPANATFNRILDNSARQLYAPAIAKLAELVPKTMAKKIPEANVQQAFVFDTVYRFLSGYRNPKILCVGSYEDTASMSLRRMGYAVEEIDPMINYSLQDYCTKPTTARNSYNIIFSTSVIEHDPDDGTFVKCIADLLAPGGSAVLTCDFKEGWKPNDLKPDVDVRLYTQQDLRDRLLPMMSHCMLVDTPQWDCPIPDFVYLGKYHYTFATFVVKKN